MEEVSLKYKVLSSETALLAVEKLKKAVEGDLKQVVIPVKISKVEEPRYFDEIEFFESAAPLYSRGLASYGAAPMMMEMEDAEDLMAECYDSADYDERAFLEE